MLARHINFNSPVRGGIIRSSTFHQPVGKRSCFLASRLAFQLQAFRLKERLYHIVRAGGVVVQVDAVA